MRHAASPSALPRSARRPGANWHMHCLSFASGFAPSTRKVDMASICVTQHLPHSVEAVWALIGDFGGLHRWHPQVQRLDLSWEGRIRTLHYADGGCMVERLEARNDATYRYVYVLVDGTLPVHACRSRLEVRADDGRSEVIWSSDFEPLGDSEAEVEAALRMNYTAGLKAVATALGEGG